MKYFVAAVIAFFIIVAVRNGSYKAPNGPYADAYRSMVMTFEPSGRLTIKVRPGARIMLNNKVFYGPSSGQVTVTSWEKKGRKIAILLPGEAKPNSALEIDGNDLLMDNIRLRPTAY